MGEQTVLPLDHLTVQLHAAVDRTVPAFTTFQPPQLIREKILMAPTIRTILSHLLQTMFSEMNAQQQFSRHLI